MLKVKVKVTTSGPGFKQMFEDLAGGSILLGSQGDDADKQHSTFAGTVGELMVMHELGLGVPERSWLRAWIDANQKSCEADMALAMQHILAGRKSRKKALEDIGYKWTQEMRENITSGKVRPAIAASTAAAKGHDIPLLDTTDGVNSISFRLFLRQIKGIADKSVREAVRRFGGR
jgi:hypothetical protein